VLIALVNVALYFQRRFFRAESDIAVEKSADDVTVYS
jgi:hypothetical protein